MTKNKTNLVANEDLENLFVFKIHNILILWR